MDGNRVGHFEKLLQYCIGCHGLAFRVKNVWKACGSDRRRRTGEKWGKTANAFTVGHAQGGGPAGSYGEIGEIGEIGDFFRIMVNLVKRENSHPSRFAKHIRWKIRAVLWGRHVNGRKSASRLPPPTIASPDVRSRIEHEVRNVHAGVRGGGGDFMPASDGSIRRSRGFGSGIRRVVFPLVDGNGQDTRSVVSPSGIVGRAADVRP